MAGGLLEQAKLGEDLTRQRYFLGKLGVDWGLLDFGFSILDCAAPRKTMRLVTRNPSCVNATLR